jgi:hypothetical protein
VRCAFKEEYGSMVARKRPKKLRCRKDGKEIRGKGEKGMKTGKNNGK